MTKVEIQALVGPALSGAVVEQVMGWRKADRAEIDGNTIVELAWVDERTNGVVKITPQSMTPDVTSDQWASKLVKEMGKARNMRLTTDFATGEYACLFAPKAQAPTIAAMIGDADFGTAIARAALLAVQP